MGQIGKFIDAVCETHPHLMRAVLEKPLAPLMHWIDFDESGQACGCLIGTAALAAGFTARGQNRHPDDHKWISLCSNSWHSPPFLADAIGMDLMRVWDVGHAVNGLSARFHSQRLRIRVNDGDRISDQRVVHLLRQRIARQLAIKESTFPVESSPPAIREVAGV